MDTASYEEGQGPPRAVEPMMRRMMMMMMMMTGIYV
jgi:hypothetical protein